MKFIRITLTKQNIKSGKVYTDTSTITDGKCATSYEKSADAQQSYMAFKQKGSHVVMNKGVLIQRYKDMTAEEIRDEVVAQIEALKKQFRKKMIIAYGVEEFKE